MVKSNPLSAKLLLSIAERECICDSDYLKELREEFFPKGFDLKKDLQDHYKQTTKQLRKIIKDVSNEYWHDKLMKTATSDMIEAINDDEEIKLMKKSIKISERLIQLFPDNSTYQKMLESDERRLLDRKLRILREANECM